MQEHATAGEDRGRHKAAHGRHEAGLVGEHHALGLTGRAAGVEDAVDLIATAARILDRLVIGDQLLVGEHALGRLLLADVNDRTQVGHLLPQHAGAKVSSTNSILVWQSLKEYATSAGLQRTLTGLTIAPAQGTAMSSS